MHRWSSANEHSDTDTDSDSSSEHGDERMNAIERWNDYARRQAAADAVEGPGANDNGLGLHNTRFQYHKRPQTSILMTDSLDRDPAVFPNPLTVRLKLPRVYRNIAQADIVQVRFMNGILPFSASRRNTTLYIGGATVTIPDGVYTLATLLTTINGLLPVGITMSYNPQTQLTVFTSAATFTLEGNGIAGRQSNWGLAWNLGFGGLSQTWTATETSPGVWTLTATALPRIYDDYFYLQLNTAEDLNMIDHTGPENVAVSQSSTGQVNHYFAKLLLNTYGGYCQTMVEMPKRFVPLLSRLERLDVTWVDRFGNPLSGYAGSLSCDWNLSLRFTEIVEGQAASAAATFSMAGGVNTDYAVDQNPPYYR